MSAAAICAMAVAAEQARIAQMNAGDDDFVPLDGLSFLEWMGVIAFTGLVIGVPCLVAILVMI